MNSNETRSKLDEVIRLATLLFPNRRVGETTAVLVIPNAGDGYKAFVVLVNRETFQQMILERADRNGYFTADEALEALYERLRLRLSSFQQRG